MDREILLTPYKKSCLLDTLAACWWSGLGDGVRLETYGIATAPSDVRALFDRQFSLAVGEPMGIAIDPTDTDVVYVGTSGRGRVSAQQQAGLFRSADGGATWVQLGSGYPLDNTGNALDLANYLINAVIVDPDQPNILYLGSSAGVWLSADSGQNWSWIPVRRRTPGSCTPGSAAAG